MKHFIKLIFCSALIISCTNLDDTLEDAVTQEFSNDGFNQGSGASGGVLLAPYDRLRAGSATNTGFFVTQGVTADDMVIPQKGNDWYDGGSWIRLYTHTYEPVHNAFSELWSQAYAGIGECNAVLDGSLNVNQTAQMKALRAYFYWRLLDAFGRVKLITKPGEDAPQSTRIEVYNFVESELLASLGIPAVTATMDLSNSPLSTEISNYRINQFAALGMLAKLYLNAEIYTGNAKNSEAEWAATYILDNSPYQLCWTGCSVPNLGKRPSVDEDPENLEGYAAVFAPNNDNNPEIIFAINYDETNGAGMNFAVMTLHFNSNLTYAFDTGIWGGFTTVADFYNTYEEDDLRRKASFLVGDQFDFNGKPLIDYAADDGDIQVSFTPEINELYPDAYRDAGARYNKFSYQIFGRIDMNNDYPIVRLGDVFLMRGEAKARAAGDWNLALPDVNLLRARAGLGPLATIDANGFLAERGKEMFQESIRRTDLIRFGKYGDSGWEKPSSEPYRTIFPIPQSQIDASNGTLTQNPGY